MSAGDSTSSLLLQTADDDDCDTESCETKQTGAISEQFSKPRRRRSGGQSPGVSPAVKKVKLEDTKTGEPVGSGNDGVIAKVGIKCDHARDAKTNNGRHGDGSDIAGLFNAALPLKREISAEEAKFDIGTVATAAADGIEKKDGDAAGAKADLLLNAAMAAEMKREIAKIERILEGRLLLSTTASATTPGLLKRRQGGLKEAEAMEHTLLKEIWSVVS